MSPPHFFKPLVSVLLPLAFAFGAQARQPLTEDELDQTNAGGVEVRVVSEEAETYLEVDSSDLFFNELFGENEVVTRLTVTIVSGMDFDFSQTNETDQIKDAEDLKAIAHARKNVFMVVHGPEEDGGGKAIINNVAGANQVETSINIAVSIPAGQSGFRGSYSNPFAVSGGAPSVPAGTGAPPAAAQAPLPQFEMPTTLGGAMSLMENMAQQHPQAAPGLNQGISTMGSLLK